jgi:GH3 auxin-responsive promoter
VSALPRLVNALWRASNLERHRRFVRALSDPARAQAEVLRALLRANAASEFGRRHDFAGLDSVRAYQQRVPLCTHEELVPDLERVRAGEPGVLTAARVERLIPSSGSSAARKLLPWTRALQAEFARAIGPWIVDLFTRPELRRGRAYWALSPALEPEGGRGRELPIGFASDGAYLGPLRRIVGRVLAVPEPITAVTDVEAFRYATLLFLLRAPDLALVSVWHPSYLTVLLELLPVHWGRLLADIRRGTLHPPGVLHAATHRALARELAPRARRADELAAHGPAEVRALWPRLALISAWGDGPARGALSELGARVPGVELQRKGLIATEAFVSLPFRGAHPLAIRSHFFEFLDARGDVHGAADLVAGEEYSLVVTTGGGLYRYRLRDRVRVEGFLTRTPSLTFLGKEDGLADLCGEKLSEGFVAARLAELWASEGREPHFVLLAPARLGGRPHYVLYVQATEAPVARLAARLEEGLRENPHYRWCRALGQLGPLRVFRVRGGGHAAFCERARTLGRRLGDVKPAVLSALDGWEDWFEGQWVEGAISSSAEHALPRSPAQGSPAGSP